MTFNFNIYELAFLLVCIIGGIVIAAFIILLAEDE